MFSVPFFSFDGLRPSRFGLWCAPAPLWSLVFGALLRRCWSLVRATPFGASAATYILLHSSTSFIIRYSSFVIHHSSFIIHHSFSPAPLHHSSFDIRHSSLIIPSRRHHFIIHHSIFIIHHSSFITHHQSTFIKYLCEQFGSAISPQAYPIFIGRQAPSLPIHFVRTIQLS
ncbi:MAG TPA: hypothetical protein ENK85_12110 [Saprospiraceae bacterium]|nr:hypothetical protein [Saprospiraceae bacterium]